MVYLVMDHDDTSNLNTHNTQNLSELEFGITFVPEQASRHKTRERWNVYLSCRAVCVMMSDVH